MAWTLSFEYWRRVIALAACLTFFSASANDAVGSTQMKFPSFGVELPLPAGWLRVSEGADATVVRMVKIEGNQLSADGTFQLEVGAVAGEPRHPTLRAYAEEEAKATGLTLQASCPPLGGKDAFELADPKPAQSRQARPVRVRVAEHAGHYYVFLQASVGDQAPRVTFDAVAAAVRFVDLVRPADALSARKSTFRLGDSGLICNLPDPFRIYRSTPNELKADAFDFRVGAGHSDAELVVATNAAPAAPDVADLERNLTKAFVKAGWNAPTWTSCDNTSATVVATNLLSRVDPSNKPAHRLQLMLAFAPNGRVATLVFDYPDDVAETYSATVLREVPTSFRSSKSYETGRAAATKP